MKGVSVSSVTRLVLLVVYVMMQIPCILVPLFFGKIFFPARHPLNRYLRSVLPPLSTGVYLLFFSIQLAVQITPNVPRARPGVSRMLLMTHSSTLDFMVVTTGAYLVHEALGGIVCIVKRELLSMPFIGWLQRAAGSIPVARSGDLAAAKKNLAIAEDRLKEGYIVAGFPEGSRRRSPSCGREQLLPFKKGMFHIAKNVGSVLFVPLVMVGGNTAWPADCLLPIPGSKVTVRIGEAISTKPNESVDDLTIRVRTCMQDEVEAAVAPKEYSIDAAFENGTRINLWKTYGFEAVLMAMPMFTVVSLFCAGML